MFDKSDTSDITAEVIAKCVCPPPIHSGDNHHMKTEEYKRRVSEKLTGKKGHPAWNKGIPMTQEAKDNITGTNNGVSQWWKITFSDGRQMIRCGLANWCKESGYSKSKVSAVYRKERKRHKDIVAVEKLAHKGS